MAGRFQPAGWQRDPESITTDRVQFWTHSGSMVTAQMPRATAQGLVRSGQATVINDQAISQSAESAEFEQGVSDGFMECIQTRREKRREERHGESLHTI